MKDVSPLSLDLYTDKEIAWLGKAVAALYFFSLTKGKGNSSYSIGMSKITFLMWLLRKKESFTSVIEASKKSEVSYGTVTTTLSILVDSDLIHKESKRSPYVLLM